MIEFPNSYMMKPMGIPLDVYRDRETGAVALVLFHECDGMPCPYAGCDRACRPDDNRAGAFKDDDK